MKLIDATPPANFPHEVIVLDSEIAQRHPTQAFYLRVRVADAEVRTMRLAGECTLAGARSEARRLGYQPTHFLETSIGYPTLLD